MALISTEIVEHLPEDFPTNLGNNTVVKAVYNKPIMMIPTTVTYYYWNKDAKLTMWDPVTKYRGLLYSPSALDYEIQKILPPRPPLTEKSKKIRTSSHRYW